MGIHRHLGGPGVYNDGGASRMRRVARRGRPGTREAWDHFDLQPIKPITRRINLLRTTCPYCEAGVTAQPPADMPEGSPFGPTYQAAAAKTY